MGQLDDLISRQAAIDALEKDIRMAKSEDGELWVAKINAQMKITLLPTITSKRGRWIEDSEGWWHCSECGRQIPPMLKQDLNEFHKWCGRCGAKMDEVEE